VPQERPGISGQNAGRNLERQWRANLAKVLDDQEKAKASWKIARSLRYALPAAPWHPAIQLLI
jgi:hypothetical protein